MRLIFALLAALHTQFSFASDACSDRAITTKADVTVSDGSSFQTESYFQSANYSAIRHLDHRDRWSVVEGPYGWSRQDDDSSGFSDFYKLFALGHQYHALLLHFDEIAMNVQMGSGDYPYGGTVHLLRGEHPSRPVGMRFEFSEDTIITTEHLDWRDQDGMSLPFHIRIDDGDRVFDYRYTEIDLAPRSPIWFFEAVPAPQVSRLQLFRLHRKLLAAHCMGDAELMASLSAPTIVSANRGEVSETSNEEMKTRFTTVFELVEYTEYHDLIEPIIEVSGDLATITVSPRAVGRLITTGQPFDDDWAWIMTARKIDGVWLHTGNASNRK